MKNLKKLTLLHSNDLHGDFLAERIDNSSSAAYPCFPAISIR